MIPDGARFDSEFRGDLLNGVVVVKGKILAAARAEDGVSITTKPHDLVAIPYYAWANRGMGEMAVWIASSENKARLQPVLPKPVRRVSQPESKILTDITIRMTPEPFTTDRALSSADESNLYYRSPSRVNRPDRMSSSPDQAIISGLFCPDKRFCILPLRRIQYEAGRLKPVKNPFPSASKGQFAQITFEP
jgi:hypothetical protein